MRFYLQPYLTRACLIGVAALVIGGCAVQPVPITKAEVASRVQTDQANLYKDQEAISKPISFNEAVARSLKYNLDYRLKLMESSLALGVADVAKYDMLPSLVASAGYNVRNNDSGGTSIGIASGVVSLIPSTSAERRRSTTGLELSWNVLDFGASYFRAQQQADQVLVAEERRRRVVQNILQDVRSAYWRAVGAQRLAREADLLMDRIKLAFERSREAESQGLVPPKEALTYQRLLLDAVQLLTTRRQELEFAKRELSALMNIPSGADFSVVEEKERDLLPLPEDLAGLEEHALQKRPELREEDYRVRITANEAKRQLLAMLPGLSFNFNAQHDSNRYLYNQSWLDSSTRVTFNMLRLLSLPAVNRSQETQVKTDEARRLAMTMVVLTQLRVAAARYRMAKADLDIARESSLIDQRLAAYARAALWTRADAELELIAAETRAMNSEYQRYTAYAAAQAAFGRVYNSIGLDVVPDGLESANIAELGEKIAANLAQIETQTFPSSNTVPVSAYRFALRVDGVVPADAEAVTKYIKRALTRNHYDIGDGGSRHVLNFQLQFEPQKTALRRAHWEISLVSPEGKKLGQMRYSSTLAADSPLRSLGAFAEAAAISSLSHFNAWLQSQQGQ